MMQIFNHMALRGKFAVISILPVTLISLTVVILTSMSHLESERENIRSLSTTLVDLLTKNISIAVFLSDPDSSDEIIGALASVPSVVYAEATNQRTGFKSSYYRPNPDGGMLEQISREISGAAPDDMFPLLTHVKRPILVENEKIGMFTLVVDTSEVRSSFFQAFYFSAFVILVATVFAAALSRSMGNRILRPIMMLRDKMNYLSPGYDDNTRLPPSGQKEIDDLYRGFNHMLDQIQERDERLAVHRHSLEELVEERTADLVELNNRRMAWLEKMAFFLQHELDNKIIGISSTMDLIERRDHEQKMTAYVDRARRTTIQMHKLLESVADATTFEAALDEEDKENLDFSTLISKQVKEYGSIYRDTGFVCDIKPAVFVYGNETRLIQLLDKLVSNAVRYARKILPVTIDLDQDDTGVTLRVTNIGDPPPKDRDRMFELSYTTGSEHGPNRGMGLYVARLIAENHSGRVRAEPIEGDCGTRLVFVMPGLVENEIT